MLAGSDTRFKDIQTQVQALGQGLRDLEKGVGLLSKQLTATSNNKKLKLYARTVETEESDDDSLSFCESVVLKESMVLDKVVFPRKFSQDATAASSLRNTKEPERAFTPKRVAVINANKAIQSDLVCTGRESIEIMDTTNITPSGISNNLGAMDAMGNIQLYPANLRTIKNFPYNALLQRRRSLNVPIFPRVFEDSRVKILTTESVEFLVPLPRPSKLTLTLRDKSSAKSKPVLLGGKVRAN